MKFIGINIIREEINIQDRYRWRILRFYAEIILVIFISYKLPSRLGFRTGLPSDVWRSIPVLLLFFFYLDPTCAAALPATTVDAPVPLPLPPVCTVVGTPIASLQAVDDFPSPWSVWAQLSAGNLIK
jgi:hypothetical protein